MLPAWVIKEVERERARREAERPRVSVPAPPLPCRRCGGPALPGRAFCEECERGEAR